MALFTRINNIIIKVLLVIGAVALMIMMAVVVGNSLGRALFRTPILGAIEFAGLTGVIVVSVAMGCAERERKNVVVDVITSQLSPRGKAIADIVALLFSFCALVFMLWAILGDAAESFSVQEVTYATSTPVAPFKFTWAVGIIIFCLFIIRNLINAIKTARKK
ncbi:MAG: TRAP transporter small permease [Deltaproteobacteria bacterium]|nr:TRAP transporter small permease [Deltaproteobacteria bacterium]